MKEYGIHAEAELELLKAIAWHEYERAGMGREFREDFEASIERINDNPLMFGVDEENGARVCLFGRFS